MLPLAETRCYQVGVIGLRITARVPDALRDYDALYRQFRRRGEAASDLSFDITRQRRRPWGPRQYVVRSGGQDYVAGPDPDAVLPELEFAINQQVIRRRSDFLQLHAAALAYRGRGLLLAADSGLGKTTLAAALVRRGWCYLSDEFALVDPVTLAVHPFPKAPVVKDGGAAMLSNLGYDLAGARCFRRRSRIPMRYLRPERVGGPCPIEWAVILGPRRGTGPALAAPTAGEAALLLYRAGLNTLAHRRGGVEAVLGVVRRARCLRLVPGPVAETCELLASLAGAPGGGRVAAGRPAPGRQVAV